MPIELRRLKKLQQTKQIVVRSKASVRDQNRFKYRGINVYK